MTPLVRRLAPLAFALAWLGLVGTASAVFPPPVKDDGKFFSSEGLDRANKKIKAIYEASRKDVVVETFAAIPADLEKKYDEKQKAIFFRDWARSRVKDLGVTGVYVLVCKKPQFLYIEVDETTKKKGFTGANYKKAFQAFVSGFKEEKFDAGLLSALDVIEAAYKANLK